MKTYNDLGLTFAKLNELEYAFLRLYKPKDDMCTTFSEIKLIDKVFDLKDKTPEELGYLRNAVVKYYHGKKDAMVSMQSVTSVIDHFKVMKGGEA